MSLGFIVVVRKGKYSPSYELDQGEHTIGSSLSSNIRLKVNNPLLLETHAVIRVNENGVATVINKSTGAPLRVNGKIAFKPIILRHEDTFFILDKEFRYFNENLKYEPHDSEIFIKEERNILASKRKSVMPLPHSPMKSTKIKTPSKRFLNQSLKTPAPKSLNKSLRTPLHRNRSVNASTSSKRTSSKRINATFDESTQDNNYFNKVGIKPQDEQSTFEKSTEEILPNLSSARSMEIKSISDGSDEVFSPVKPISTRKSIRNFQIIGSTFGETAQGNDFNKVDIKTQGEQSTFEESTEEILPNLSSARSMDIKSISDGSEEVFSPVKPMSSRKSVRNSQNNLSIRTTRNRSSTKHVTSLETSPLSASSNSFSSFEKINPKRNITVEHTDFDMNIAPSQTKSNSSMEKRMKSKSQPQSPLNRSVKTPNKFSKTAIEKTLNTASTKRSIAALRRSHTGYSTPKKILHLKNMEKINKSLPKDHILLNIDENSVQDLKASDVAVNIAINNSDNNSFQPKLTKRSIAALRRSYARSSTPKKLLHLQSIQKVNKSLPKDHVLLDIDDNSRPAQHDVVVSDVDVNSALNTEDIFFCLDSAKTIASRKSNSIKENIEGDSNMSSSLHNRSKRISTKRQQSLSAKDSANNSLKNEYPNSEPFDTSDSRISSLQVSTDEHFSREEFSVRASTESKRKRITAAFDESTQDNNLNQSENKSQHGKSTFEESTKELLPNMSSEKSTKPINTDSEETLSPVKHLSPKKSLRNSQSNLSISIVSEGSTRSLRNRSDNSSLTATSLEHHTGSVISVSSQSFSSFKKIDSKVISIVDDTEIDVVNITVSSNTSDVKDFDRDMLKTPNNEQHPLSQRPSITSQMFNDVSCTSTPFLKQHAKKELDHSTRSMSPKESPKLGRSRSASSNVLEISGGALVKRRSSRSSVSKNGKEDCISCNHSSVKRSRSNSASSDRLNSSNAMNTSTSRESIRTETPILHRVSRTLMESDNTPEKLSSSEDETPKSHIKPTRRSSKANQSGYNPVTEDITPVTPEKFQVSGFTEEAFKTPINTPGLFESIRKSAVRSRKRRRESHGSVLKDNKRARVDFLQEEDTSDSLQTQKNFTSEKRQRKSPRNSLSNFEGVKKLLRTPPKSPKNDLTNVPNLKKMMSPKEQKMPVNDLTDVSGVAKMFNLSGVEVLHQGSDVGNSEDPFTKLTGKQPVRAYRRGKSMSPSKADPQESDISRKTMGDLPSCSPRVQEWVNEHVHYNVDTNQEMFTNMLERPECRPRRGRSMSLRNELDKTKRRNTLRDVLTGVPNINEWKVQQNYIEDKNALDVSIANALDNISNNPRKTPRMGRSMSPKKSVQSESNRRKTQGYLLKSTPNVKQWKSEHPKVDDSTPEVQNANESILKNVSDQPRRKSRVGRSVSPMLKDQKNFNRRKSQGDVLKTAQDVAQWKAYKKNAPKMHITGEDEDIFSNMLEKPNVKSRREQSTSPKKPTIDRNRRKTYGDILNTTPNVQEWTHRSKTPLTNLVEKSETKSSSGRHITPNKSILNSDYVQFKARKSSLLNTSLLNHVNSSTPVRFSSTELTIRDQDDRSREKISASLTSVIDKMSILNQTETEENSNQKKGPLAIENMTEVLNSPVNKRARNRQGKLKTDEIEKSPSNIVPKRTRTRKAKMQLETLPSVENDHTEIRVADDEEMGTSITSKNSEKDEFAAITIKKTTKKKGKANVAKHQEDVSENESVAIEEQPTEILPKTTRRGRPRKVNLEKSIKTIEQNEENVEKNESLSSKVRNGSTEEIDTKKTTRGKGKSKAIQKVEGVVTEKIPSRSRRNLKTDDEEKENTNKERDQEEKVTTRTRRKLKIDDIDEELNDEKKQVQKDKVTSRTRRNLKTDEIDNEQVHEEQVISRSRRNLKTNNIAQVEHLDIEDPNKDPSPVKRKTKRGAEETKNQEIPIPEKAITRGKTAKKSAKPKNKVIEDTIEADSDFDTKIEIDEKQQPAVKNTRVLRNRKAKELPEESIEFNDSDSGLSIDDYTKVARKTRQRAAKIKSQEISTVKATTSKEKVEKGETKPRNKVIEEIIENDIYSPRTRAKRGMNKKYSSEEYELIEKTNKSKRKVHFEDQNSPEVSIKRTRRTRK